ncbi:MAG: bifunctional adenosylcobinamide kinase/adenosylcobinamide-phosphate guanylyltransferase [Candidatus Atribacteria bacterium]|nr:bifunctional adenosylcobinamide kinase/adenosylcobinamide-phosphate guanylyltransferase [Candidatus Atribacteria bacterium]
MLLERIHKLINLNDRDKFNLSGESDIKKSNIELIPQSGKIYFLLGGARSGKSEYAEQFATSLSEKVAYLATATITDEEMEKRVQQHKKRRPLSWRTFEIESENIDLLLISGIVEKINASGCEVLLIDCITNLLFRLAYKYNIENLELIDNKLEKIIENEIASFFDNFLKLLKSARFDSIVVSNEVGLGIVPAYPFGRIFRDLMGVVNKKMAAAADEVYFFVAGLKQKLK